MIAAELRALGSSGPWDSVVPMGWWHCGAVSLRWVMVTAAVPQPVPPVQGPAVCPASWCNLCTQLFHCSLLLRPRSPHCCPLPDLLISPPALPPAFCPHLHQLERSLLSLHAGPRAALWEASCSVHVKLRGALRALIPGCSDASEPGAADLWLPALGYTLTCSSACSLAPQPPHTRHAPQLRACL